MKIFMGLLLGVIIGILVYNLPSGTFKDNILIGGIFELLGQVFFKRNYDDGDSFSIYFIS